MTYAIYRCLYGEDFIQESIKSIQDHVDKIFVFYDDTPWGNVTHCNYKNQLIQFPKKFDNILDKIKELNNNKITLIYDHVENNINQFTHLVNDLILPNYTKPNKIVCIEVDHVLHQNQLQTALDEIDYKNLQCATTTQIEHWKTPLFHIPNRNRISTVIWNMKNINCLPPTYRQADIPNMPILDTKTHNFGFCASEKVMYWKHLTAIAFSQKIQDSPPNIDWLENKWQNWHPINNNSNLEISIGYEHLIPQAYPFDPQNLPIYIKQKYNL